MYFNFEFSIKILETSLSLWKKKRNNVAGIECWFFYLCIFTNAFSISWEIWRWINFSVNVMLYLLSRADAVRVKKKKTFPFSWVSFIYYTYIFGNIYFFKIKTVYIRKLNITSAFYKITYGITIVVVVFLPPRKYGILLKLRELLIFA